MKPKQEALSVEHYAAGNGSRVRIGGHVLCPWMVGLGRAGYTPSQVQHLLHDHLGLTEVRESTIRTRVGVGNQLGRGATPSHPYRPARITPADRAGVWACVGEPERPGDPAHAGLGIARGSATAGGVFRPGQVAGASDDDPLVEGREQLRLHRRKERKGALVRRRKRQVLGATGRLACEVCDADFAAVYGPLGEGYAECHHTLPLAALQAERRTRPSELAVVCANCHRMLHRPPFHSVAGLRAIVRSRRV